MRAILPPSDTRLRGDQRLWEEGQENESDEEKIRLEVKQRKNRKLRNDAGETWTQNLFKEIPHPFIQGERQYEWISQNNYWDRRERGDWRGLPDLWS